MKARLEYNCPEEEGEMLIALHGVDFYFVLYNIEAELRLFCRGKKELGGEIKTPLDALDFVRDLMREELEEKHLSLDMLP